MISSISSKSGKPKSRGRQGKTTTVEEFLRGSDFEEYAPSKIQEKIMGQFPQALASQVFSLVYDLNRINSVSKPIIRDAIENYQVEFLTTSASSAEHLLQTETNNINDKLLL